MLYLYTRLSQPGYVDKNGIILAEEPSVAQGTHSFSRRLPAFGRFYWLTKFLLLNLINLT